MAVRERTRPDPTRACGRGEAVVWLCTGEKGICHLHPENSIDRSLWTEAPQIAHALNNYVPSMRASLEERNGSSRHMVYLVVPGPGANGSPPARRARFTMSSSGCWNLRRSYAVRELLLLLLLLWDGGLGRGGRERCELPMRTRLRSPISGR